MISSQFKHQEKVLTDRYLDCKLGDFKTTMILLLQSPFIASLIAYRFHNAMVTDFLYFSLSLSALWFGCSNAAREIVKEKAIFCRERLFFLNVGAYLVSKMKVLNLLGFIQALCLVLIVNYYVPLAGFIMFHIANVFLTILAGIALGLLISSLVNTVHQADALVPIVLIPQILFSPIVMSEDYLKGWAYYIDKVMILRWSYNAFLELVNGDGDFMQYVTNMGVMVLMIVGMFAITYFFLKNKDIVY